MKLKSDEKNNFKNYLCWIWPLNIKMSYILQTFATGLSSGNTFLAYAICKYFCSVHYQTPCRMHTWQRIFHNRTNVWVNCWTFRSDNHTIQQEMWIKEILLKPVGVLAHLTYCSGQHTCQQSHLQTSPQNIRSFRIIPLLLLVL